MNTPGTNEFLDWSETFDDMDGDDWEEHFSILDEPYEETRERELKREIELDEEQEREDQEYADRLERIIATATLGQLAEYHCPIEAKCLDCHHHALLNPEHLLGKMQSGASIREIETRLRCQQCGSRSAAARFDPEELDV